MVVGGLENERLFSIDATPGGTMVTAMRDDNPILGDMPQPKMKRHRRIGQIVLQATVRFDQHVLNHIADVDALTDFRIEPHLDHSPEGVAMSVQEFVDRIAVTLPSTG